MYYLSEYIKYSFIYFYVYTCLHLYTSTPDIATPDIAKSDITKSDIATPDITKSEQLTYLLLRMYEGEKREIRGIF